MRRFVVVALILIAVVGLATWAGFAHHRAQPIGDLFYTPNGPCPTYSHSFTVGYFLVLGLAVASAGLVSVFCALGAIFSKDARRPMLAILKFSVPIAILLIPAFFAYPAFEARLPLQSEPGCATSHR